MFGCVRVREGAVGQQEDLAEQAGAKGRKSLAFSGDCPLKPLSMSRGSREPLPPPHPAPFCWWCSWAHPEQAGIALARRRAAPPNPPRPPLPKPGNHCQPDNPPPTPCTATPRMRLAPVPGLLGLHLEAVQPQPRGPRPAGEARFTMNRRSFRAGPFFRFPRRRMPLQPSTPSSFSPMYGPPPRQGEFTVHLDTIYPKRIRDAPGLPTRRDTAPAGEGAGGQRVANAPPTRLTRRRPEEMSGWLHHGLALVTRS